MKIQTMLLTNLCFVVIVFLLLVNSVEGGHNLQKPITRCKEIERRALMAFKADVVDEYGILSSWNKSKVQDCCNWRGIRCSNRTGHVIVLDVTGNSRSYTWLRGNIGSSLSELKHLMYLNLSNNDFDGEIPHQLGNLTNLRSLDLSVNVFLFAENLNWLSHLRLLTHLDLGGVSLNSCTDWLNQIHGLFSLTELVFSYCSLPDSRLLHVNISTSMRSLSLVDLSFNDFISPSSYNWLFNFTRSLAYIDLTDNQFFRGSSIPEAFGSFLSLDTLTLTSCQLEGMLPQSFRNLSHLATLDLRYNNLAGSLSEFLYPLATKQNNSLQSLNLNHNQLSSSLPDYFTTFPSLQVMAISFNMLSGPFPENFRHLSWLVQLELSSNQITGLFPNLTLFSSLEILSLHTNKLADSVPEAYFSNLSRLKYLSLYGNSLSLNFSLEWQPPFQLEVLMLQNCVLGPHFPNWLQSQWNLSALDISATSISGTVPLFFWDFSPRLSYLNMSYNQIEATLPDLSLKFPRIRWIDLSSNRLKGPILSVSPKTELLHISKNMLTGPVSFICRTAYKSLTSLDLSNNKLSGELPDCWANAADYLSFLNLANNNLFGEIPTSIGFLHRLQILQLRSNNFVGKVTSLINNTELIVLDLSENKLSGYVPTWIGRLVSLIVLSLRKNEFLGSVPLQICQMTNAQVLDLSHNRLIGSIPNCINNLTSLLKTVNNPAAVSSVVLRDISYTDESNYVKFEVNAFVQWKGQDSEYQNTLGLLKLIDLSTNRISGKIPEEFTDLQGLISLNLSSNSLIGNISPKIGQMKMLEILDLSKNQLSGEIPTNLASLTFLSVLDLSNNNLTGRIPSSTQLQSFNASVYTGNEQLCGLPLLKCGGVVHSPPPTVVYGKDESNEEENDKFTKIGLYVSAILGFFTGFWGLLCPVFLRSSWRYAYWKLVGKIADWIYITTTTNMARLQRKIYG